MRFDLEVEDADVRRLHQAHQRLAAHELVRERVTLNVEPMHRAPTREDLWRCLALALTTSQQRSGPGSRVWKLGKANPCPLRLDVIRSWEPDVGQRAGEFLKEWGGIRWHHRIGQYLEDNYRRVFEDEGERKRLGDVTEMLWRLRKLPPEWNDNARRLEREGCTLALELGLKGIGTRRIHITSATGGQRSGHRGSAPVD